MGETPSSARIIKYVERALEAMEIVFRKDGAAFEGLADINGLRLKEVGKGESSSWGGVQTKCEGCECELTKIYSSTVIC